jgi:MFS family permease
MTTGYISLLKERTFLPLFLTQFFAAFNDNAFKLAMLTLISYHLAQSQTLSEHYQALAGALFIFPFFLFSATAGQLADKYDKAKMTRYVKVLELLLMIVGAFGLYQGSILLMMVTLAGMGIHSAFFGPIKYAILPDHLPRKDLLQATGLIEASTFMAILLGTTMGTLSIGSVEGHVYVAIVLTLLAAVAGLVASFFIPKAPSSLHDLDVDWHVWRATFAMIHSIWQEMNILIPILSLSWFWLIGAVILTKLPDFTHYVLGANTTVFALFLALFSIGIGVGSIVIGRLLSGRITLAYVPISMLALSGFIFDLYWTTNPLVSSTEPLVGLVVFFHTFAHWRIAFDLFMLAFSAGLFIVPLYTYLQIACDPKARARTIAANNIVNALFMVFGTVMVMVLLYFTVSIAHVFMILSILNALFVLGIWIMLWKNKEG